MAFTRSFRTLHADPPPGLTAWTARMCPRGADVPDLPPPPKSPAQLSEIVPVCQGERVCRASPGCLGGCCGWPPPPRNDKAPPPPRCRACEGASPASSPSKIRTYDLVVNSHPLYLLSYRGTGPLARRALYQNCSVDTTAPVSLPLTRHPALDFPDWRRGPELNRGTGLCRPLHHHSATAPLPQNVLQTDACLGRAPGKGREIYWAAPEGSSCTQVGYRRPPLSDGRGASI